MESLTPLPLAEHKVLSRALAPVVKNIEIDEEETDEPLTTEMLSSGLTVCSVLCAYGSTSAEMDATQTSEEQRLVRIGWPFNPASDSLPYKEPPKGCWQRLKASSPSSTSPLGEASAGSSSHWAFIPIACTPRRAAPARMVSASRKILALADEPDTMELLESCFPTRPFDPIDLRWIGAGLRFGARLATVGTGQSKMWARPASEVLALVPYQTPKRQRQQASSEAVQQDVEQSSSSTAVALPMSLSACSPATAATTPDTAAKAPRAAAASPRSKFSSRLRSALAWEEVSKDLMPAKMPRTSASSFKAPLEASTAPRTTPLRLVVAVQAVATGRLRAQSAAVALFCYVPIAFPFSQEMLEQPLKSLSLASPGRRALPLKDSAVRDSPFSRPQLPLPQPPLAQYYAYSTFGFGSGVSSFAPSGGSSVSSSVGCRSNAVPTMARRVEALVMALSTATARHGRQQFRPSARQALAIDRHGVVRGFAPALPRRCPQLLRPRAPMGPPLAIEPLCWKAAVAVAAADRAATTALVTSTYCAYPALLDAHDDSSRAKVVRWQGLLLARRAEVRHAVLASSSPPKATAAAPVLELNTTLPSLSVVSRPRRLESKMAANRYSAIVFTKTNRSASTTFFTGQSPRMLRILLARASSCKRTFAGAALYHETTTITAGFASTSTVIRGSVRLDMLAEGEYLRNSASAFPAFLAFSAVVTGSLASALSNFCAQKERCRTSALKDLPVSGVLEVSWPAPQRKALPAAPAMKALTLPASYVSIPPAVPEQEPAFSEEEDDGEAAAEEKAARDRFDSGASTLCPADMELDEQSDDDDDLIFVDDMDLSDFMMVEDAAAKKRGACEPSDLEGDEDWHVIQTANDSLGFAC